MSESGTGTYSMTETTSNFVLNEAGNLGKTIIETGNTVNGDYSQTITAGDSYTMTETGTNPGGAFLEVVTGSDAATLTETGNPATQTFNRTITGDGTYTRTDSGPGATLSNVPNGSITYTLQETGDSLGAVFGQTETGGDRYGLLEHFVDVSNTGGGNTPGNMNFLPFGQAFVDPGPEVVQNRRDSIRRQLRDLIDELEHPDEIDRAAAQVRREIRTVEALIRMAEDSARNIGRARDQLLVQVVGGVRRAVDPSPFAPPPDVSALEEAFRNLLFFDGLYQDDLQNLRNLYNYHFEL